jgi:SAM-dependent methyltransferase
MSHSDLAALRGEPSYVWRSGQERRLGMIARWAALEGARVLDAGCGVGMYTDQFRRRYTPHVDGIEYEFDRAREARITTPRALVAAAEHLPYAGETFDTVLSHETLEHVADDRAAAREMIRVLRVGGRAVIFCPNRWYPFETHGHYWRGRYHFGNTPLINYLPDALRDRLAPHVRAYTKRGLLRLFDGLPARVVHHSRVYGGGDTLARRFGGPGRALADLLQAVEPTPLSAFGLSHFLVIEKTARYNPAFI